MKNRKNGFTLVEMLVCIGIIAALGVVIGLNASDILKDTQNEDHEAVMDDLFDAAKIFVELSSSEAICGSLSTSTDGYCNVAIFYLVSKGLIEDTIYDKDNPMKKNGKFTSGDIIKVSKSGGKKTASYTISTCVNDISGCAVMNYVNDTNLKGFKCWGGCN